MKKIISAMTMLSLSIAVHCQTLAKAGATQATFGRYGADCSSGRGACSFSVSKTEENLAFGANSKKISNTDFVFQIARKTLTKEDELRIAGAPFTEVDLNQKVFFEQQEDLYLDEATVRNLGVDPAFTLVAAGNYPMFIDQDKVEITFTLIRPSEPKH